MIYGRRNGEYSLSNFYVTKHFASIDCGPAAVILFKKHLSMRRESASQINLLLWVPISLAAAATILFFRHGFNVIIRIVLTLTLKCVSERILDL